MAAVSYADTAFFGLRPHPTTLVFHSGSCRSTQPELMPLPSLRLAAVSRARLDGKGPS